MSDKIPLRNRDLHKVQRGLKVLSQGINDGNGVRKFDFNIDDYWDISKNLSAIASELELYSKVEADCFERNDVIPGEETTRENKERIKSLRVDREALDLKQTNPVFIPLNAASLIEKNQKTKIPPETMADIWPLLDPTSIPQ